MIRIGTQYKFRRINAVERIVAGVCLTSRLLFGGLLATFCSFLAIKIFNPNLMEKITQSSKFAEFIFSKKFVLGLGIALMGVLLIAKVLSVIDCLINCVHATKDNGSMNYNISKKEHFSMWTQIAIGITASVSGIVCMSLMLANKISPEVTSIMEKVFLGGFGIAIIGSILTGLAMLIGGVIINKTMTQVEAGTHNQNLNTFAEISGGLFGGFGYAIEGSLPFTNNHDSKNYQLRDNFVSRNAENNCVINFLDVFRVEFDGKKIQNRI